MNKILKEIVKFLIYVFIGLFFISVIFGRPNDNDSNGLVASEVKIEKDIGKIVKNNDYICGFKNRDILGFFYEKKINNNVISIKSGNDKLEHDIEIFSLNNSEARSSIYGLGYYDNMQYKEYKVYSINNRDIQTYIFKDNSMVFIKYNIDDIGFVISIYPNNNNKKYNNELKRIIHDSFVMCRDTNGNYESSGRMDDGWWNSSKYRDKYFEIIIDRKLDLMEQHRLFKLDIPDEISVYYKDNKAIKVGVNFEIPKKNPYSGRIEYEYIWSEIIIN